MDKYENIKLFVKAGSRGEGRNYGVSKSKGDIIVFTDGGCKADKDWLKNLTEGFKSGFDVVAGKTIDVGGFSDINRLHVKIDEFDITYPSCNLAYKKELFEKINGFDKEFVTAEDIDLNFKAVKNNAKIGFSKKAIIYRKSAKNYKELIKQSFWYGYGRKQLSIKHGKLWKNYSLEQMFCTQMKLSGLVRLFFGLIGYTVCKIQK